MSVKIEVLEPITPLFDFATFSCDVISDWYAAKIQVQPITGLRDSRVTISVPFDEQPNLQANLTVVALDEQGKPI